MSMTTHQCENCRLGFTVDEEWDAEGLRCPARLDRDDDDGGDAVMVVMVMVVATSTYAPGA